jgi:hypothetical protein
MNPPFRSLVSLLLLLVCSVSVRCEQVFLSIIALSKQSNNIQHWLHYYYQLGVHRVFLISNDCDDEDFDGVLQDVRTVPVPADFVTLISDFRCVSVQQQMVYKWTNECVQKSWRQMKLPALSSLLTLFVDTDEYVVVKQGLPLTTLLMNPSLHGNIFDRSKMQFTMLWKAFGTSGHMVQPREGTYVSNFILRTSDCDLPTQLPEAPGSSGAGFDGHVDKAALFHLQISDFHSCNERYEGKINHAALPYFEKPMCDADWFGNSPQLHLVHYCASAHPSTTQLVNSSKVWVNHYVTRSREEWFSKINRGRAGGGNFVASTFSEPAKEEELVDVYNNVVDLDAIESVFKLCKSIRGLEEKLEAEEVKSQKGQMTIGSPRNTSSSSSSKGRNAVEEQAVECCVLDLLGVPGTIASTLPPATNKTLVKYCKQHKIKYEKSCKFLLDETPPDQSKQREMKLQCSEFLGHRKQTFLFPSANSAKHLTEATDKQQMIQKRMKNDTRINIGSTTTTCGIMRANMLNDPKR